MHREFRRKVTLAQTGKFFAMSKLIERKYQGWPTGLLKEHANALSRGVRVAMVAALGTCLVFQATPMLKADAASPIEEGTLAPSVDEYRLGIRDKVRIQVFEWRPARDELFTWTALNQVYTVDPSGALSLPLIGQVKAAGYTTSELGSLISRKLAKRLNLGATPDATVEVTEFRPVFVTGHVEKAGEYAYMPGMTVLQGVSLGGGLYRNGAAGGLRLEREFLTVSGEYDRLLQERERLVVRKARIEAELAFADRIAFPTDLRTTRRPYKVEFTSSLMAKEQSVFELRQKAYETQITALNQLKTFLDQEVETLGKRLDAHQTQIDLMNAELGGIKSLSDKGLATQPRVLGLKRNLAQLEGERLRMESERTRAQQEVSRVALSKIEFENKRANDLTIELQQTESRLEQVVQEASVSEQLLIETRAQAATSPLRMVSTSGGTNGPEAGTTNSRPDIRYTIVRQVRGVAIEMDATESTVLQPGDTIKVSMSLPSAADIGSGLSVGAPGSFLAPGETPVMTIEQPKAPHRASVEEVSTQTIPR
jgi:polysaccharide export outer membrane protein/exopolysaccharide production protein ExoF